MPIRRDRDLPAEEAALPAPAWPVSTVPAAPEWVLLLDGGEAIRLPGDVVVLGRASAPAADGVPAIALPDPTRTLSKVHARLERAGGRWTITDLGSMNGVVLGEGEDERVLAAGESAVVTGRFLLGELGVRIERAGSGA